MPKHPAKNGCSTQSRSTYWFFRKATSAWAIVKRRVGPRMEISLFSETAVLLDKRHHLFVRRHEIRAAVSGHHDRAASIAQPRGPVPVPAAQMAEQEARRECVAGAQNIGYFHREPGHVDGRRRLGGAAQVDPRAVGAALFDQRGRAQS